MNVTFTCPTCDAVARQELTPETTELRCTSCNRARRVPENAVQGDRLTRCIVCPCQELFVRKDFSQRVGISIIVAGFAASTVAWAYHRPILTFAILFATALIDLVLYFVVGNVLHCYRCQAEYRGVQGLEEHGGFSLETYERFRQQAARLAQAQSATAAPRAAGPVSPGVSPGGDPPAP